MRVAVVGAGIGGLCAAVGLRRAGADVEIFERAEHIRAGGSGLSIFGNGSAALAALGLQEAFANATGRPDTDLVGGQRRPNGSWLSRTPSKALESLRIIDRHDLHELLRSAVAGVRIRLGVEASATREGFVRWRGDGQTHQARYDMVIGADGIASTVRRSLWNDSIAIRFAGYSAWRGITCEPVDLHGEAGETWGKGERFGIAPLRDGRVYWFAVATLPEDIRFVDEYGEVRRRFSGWHDPIGEIIRKTRPTDVFRRDICDLAEPLTSYVQGRVVLLGDAAHAMTPDLGQGGNQAMEDAVTLAALLAPIAPVEQPPAADLAAALQRYDQLRRPRTQAIARQARALGAMAHAKGPLRVLARDTLMRLVPPGVMARRMLAIQSWQPPLPS